MDRTLLIAPADNALGRALVEHAHRAGYRVAAAVRGDQEGVGGDERLLSLRWAAQSFVSARNVVLSAINQFGTIDSAVIIKADRRESHAVHEASPLDIETHVDDDIKAPLFVMKEMLSHYTKTGRGMLGFALHQPSGDPAPPLDLAADSYFRSLVNALFTVYQNESFRLNGFESRSDNAEQFAGFILRQIETKADQTSGKWYRHSGGPLSRLGIA